MGIFTEADLEYDYIYKTKKNMEFIEEQCNREMEDNDDMEMSEMYEITQLMNSFFGLLMIPREGYFDLLQKDFAEGTGSREIYEKLKWEHSKYCNTFLQRENKKILYTSEEMTAKTLLRRMRKAIANGGFKPYPDYATETGLIEGYEFTDHATIYGYFGSNVIRESKPEALGSQPYEQNFRIILSMDEIRTLFFDFCDLILSHYEDEEEPEEVVEEGEEVTEAEESEADTGTEADSEAE